MDMSTSEVTSEETARDRLGESPDAWREDLARTWGRSLPRGTVEWARWPVTIEPLVVVPNSSGVPELMSSWILADRLGLVVSSPETVDEYVERFGRADVEVPSTYSEFTAGHRPVASRTVGDREYSIPADRLEAALRVLNGKGRFDRDEYRLVDCSPAPSVLRREDVGAVLLTPTSART